MPETNWSAKSEIKRARTIMLIKRTGITTKVHSITVDPTKTIEIIETLETIEVVEITTTIATPTVRGVVE